MTARRRDPHPNLTAARTGDTRKALEELRDTLAAELDNCLPTVVAQVAGQYRTTLEALAALDDDKQKGGTVDELKARREGHKGRRATTDASANA